MSELQTISITVGILTACITVIIGVLSFMRSNQRAEEQRKIELKTQELALQTQQQALVTRQAELFMQLYNRWTSRDFSYAFFQARYNYTDWTDYEEWLEKYGFHNLEANSSFSMLANFFEGVGVLVRRGLIDIHLVSDMIAGRAIQYWEQFEPIAKGHRQRLNDPHQYDAFEYLAAEMKKLQAYSTIRRT